MKNLLSSLYLFFLCFYSHQLAAEQSVESSEPIIIQLVTENSFPFNYQEHPNTEIKGYSTELIKAILADAGIEYKITLLPWIRAYKRASNNINTLIFSIGRTTERENQFKWIGEILPMSYNIYGLTENQPKLVETIEEIKNKPVGVARNDIRHSFLKKKGFTNLVFTNGNIHTHKLLKRGRIDYFLASHWGIEQFKADYNLQSKEIIPILGFDELKTGIYFAFSKQTSDFLVNRVKDSFNRIKTNGSYDKIMQPVLEQLYESEQNK